MQDKLTTVLLLGAGVLLGILATTTLTRQEAAQAQPQRGGAAGGGAMPPAAAPAGGASVAVAVSGPYVFIVHARANDVGTYVYHCNPETRQVTAISPINATVQPKP
jgi:hypothetical protein